MQHNRSMHQFSLRVHKVLTVVYCDRENEITGDTDIRIIFARLATRSEQMIYNNNLLGRF